MNPWGLNKDFLLLIMQITREVPDYCQPVRRSRRIVAALSPDYRRHFNRWKTKITYSNIPSTGLITRLFTLKNRIWGHYIPVKAWDKGYITYSGVAASISSKLLNDNHIIFIVLCPGTNGYRGRRQVFFVAWVCCLSYFSLGLCLITKVFVWTWKTTVRCE